MNQLVAIQRDLSDGYQFFIKIGQGTFANVYKARQKSTNMQVAIKQIDLVELPEGVYDYMLSEVEIMQKSQNQNIVKLIESKENENFIYIIMEYCAMDLDVLWDQYFNRHLAEKHVIVILRQIVNGFSHLHSNYIIHRDIKLENIMVHLSDQALKDLKDGKMDAIYEATYKIADMGLSKQLQSGDELTQTYAGSPMTMAPEVLEQRDYGIQADMYSLGVITYQMLFGGYPFDEDSGDPQELVIKRQKVDFKYKGVQISKKMEELLRKMLKYEPSQRLSWVDLYQQPFFKSEPLNMTSIIDCNFQKNRTIYKSMCDKNSTLQNHKAKFNKQIEKQQIENEAHSPPFQNLIVVEEEEDMFQQFETIQLEDQQSVFFQRLYDMRNNYILVQRAFVQLALLTYGGPFNLKESLHNYASLFQDVSNQLYNQFYSQLRNDENILKISGYQWDNLVNSEEYQYLKDLVTIIDKQLFDGHSFVQQEESKPTQQSVFSIFGMAKSIFGLVKGKERPSIFSAGFDSYFKEQVKECVRILLLNDGLKNEVMNSEWVFKLNIINLLRIYRLFDKSEITRQIHDTQYEDIELQIEVEQPQLLEQKIKQLAIQMNYSF